MTEVSRRILYVDGDEVMHHDEGDDMRWEVDPQLDLVNSSERRVQRGHDAVQLTLRRQRVLGEEMCTVNEAILGEVTRHYNGEN